MRDELHQNHGTMTGTPTLVAGALREDGNQALQFDGSTNRLTIPDSASSSLAIADGGAGGMALGLFLKLTATPGSTKKVVRKQGSYALDVTAARTLQWSLANGAQNVTVTSAAALTVGTWYHVVCVYNGDYTGATVFGNQTQGSSQATTPGDRLWYDPAPSNQNLRVSQETILEKGRITSVVIDLARNPNVGANQWLAAVVYQDDGSLPTGLPGAKLAQSASQLIGNVGAYYLPARAWVTFPVDCVVYPGKVWLGFVGGNASDRLLIGQEGSGGKRAWRHADVSDSSTYALTGSAPDSFAAPTATDTGRYSNYANYTPLARTGEEGHALIYINGVEDARSAYTRGIADSTSDTVFAEDCACQIDEPAIYNKKLTAVQVATHYAAR